MNEIAPALRMDLDFIPVEHQGEQILLIRDPLGLVPEGRAIPRHMARVLRLLDGSRTLAQMQEDMTRENGNAPVAREFIETLLGELDETYLLATERYQAARLAVMDAFEAELVRPCALAGSGYPAEPGELRCGLDDLLSSAEIPAAPPGAVSALIAPHIDFKIGGRAYARAYALLRDLRPARVVVLGVGHHLAEAMFSVSAKDFATPLGVVPGEPELARALCARGGAAVAKDEFSHRGEHSIEFQLLFLRHLLPPDSFRILPVLCGPAAFSREDYSRGSFRNRAEGFLDALSIIVRDPQTPTLVVAGVDFSHVGLKFGDRMPANRLQAEAMAHDAVLLERLCAFDSDGFWAESARVADRFHVCGFSALACLLEILPPSRGSVLEYHHWHEDATHSAVGFAAAVMAKS